MSEYVIPWDEWYLDELAEMLYHAARFFGVPSISVRSQVTEGVEMYLYVQGMLKLQRAALESQLSAMAHIVYDAVTFHGGLPESDQIAHVVDLVCTRIEIDVKRGLLDV